MLLSLILATALANPPSSTLSGPDGRLTWAVEANTEGVTIRGSSPKWTVLHTAAGDLSPLRTVHQDPDNGEVIIDYTADGATVSRRGKQWTIDRAGLWDGDTVDVRLGASVAKGQTDLAFAVVDPASGKVYRLDSTKVEDDRCGSVACTHVRVQLTGLLRLVGPTWHYWYGQSGQLLRFDGPAGNFDSVAGP